MSSSRRRISRAFEMGNQVVRALVEVRGRMDIPPQPARRARGTLRLMREQVETGLPHLGNHDPMPLQYPFPNSERRELASCMFT